MTRSLMSALRLPLLAGALVALTSIAQAAEPAAKAPAPSGQAVYEHWCAPCHAPGPGHPGTQSLQVKYGGKTPAVLLERTDLAPQAISVFVRQGVLLMAPFRKTEVSDAELAALSAYVAKNFKSK
ncbi:MAG: cytochrome c [Gammaproteobacteria bacterium]